MEIYQNIYNCIVNECNKRGYGMPKAIYCHMYNETGKFKSSLWTKYYNPAGMKCGSSWKGKSVNMATKEEYKPGVLTSIRDNFRAYDTMEAGIAGYFDFLSYGRYQAARESKTDEAFIDNLKAGGWWTSSTQSNTLKTLLKEFDKVANINTKNYNDSKVIIRLLQHVINEILINDTPLVEDGVCGPKTKAGLTKVFECLCG